MKHISLLLAAMLTATAVLAPTATADPIDDALDAVEDTYFCALYGEGNNCQGTPNPCGSQPIDECIPLGELIILVVDTACPDGPSDCAPEGPKDTDGDGYTDDLEEELCGRAIVRDELNGEPFLGRCDSPSNFNDEELQDTLGIVGGVPGVLLGLILGTYSLVDSDGDLVPDSIEPTLCSAENENANYDGTCQGDDYTP